MTPFLKKNMTKKNKKLDKNLKDFVTRYPHGPRATVMKLQNCLRSINSGTNVPSII